MSPSCGSAAFAVLGTAVAVCGCGRLGFDRTAGDGDAGADWTFVDDGPESFELGNYAAGDAPLIWRTDRVELANTPPYDTTREAVYISRPFEAGDSEARWQTLAWVPVGPHGRPLPAAAASDSGYLEDGIDMRDNILLLHFDDLTDSNGDVVADASGQEHDGQLVFDGQTAANQSGAFGLALDMQRDAWVSLNGDYFDYGTGDFSYSVWVKMQPCSESSDNRIALGGAGAGDDPHMWIGSLCPGSCPGEDGAFMNFLDASRSGPSLSACTGVVLHDGDWHHLAGVKQGHNPATVKLFVDGREVASETHDFGDDLTYDGGEIRLGSFNLNDPQYHTRITVDEAAIWKRALAGEEVSAVYRRGALGLGLQLRVCADGTCDDEPFIGPDGTSGSYFTEADLTGPPGSQSGNLTSLDLVGPVAQYRVRFTTASTSDSPGLRRVTVLANRR